MRGKVAVIGVGMIKFGELFDKGLETMVNLIKTHFAGGGYGLQFNIYDVETLRDAQKHPEKYAGLQVRLTGWSVYFTTLSEFEQEQFIRRIAHQ